MSPVLMMLLQMLMQGQQNQPGPPMPQMGQMPPMGPMEVPAPMSNFPIDDPTGNAPNYAALAKSYLNGRNV